MERQSGRSRSPQSPSQSHSASASVSSSTYRRKLDSDDNASPFPLTQSEIRDVNLTPNDDPNKTMSSRSEDSDEAGNGDGEGDNSIRAFRTARLEKKRKAGSRIGKVKIEKDEDFVPRGIVVKKEEVAFFEENFQKTGAYTAREDNLKREEAAGLLKFVYIANDGVDQHMIWLMALKNIFASQLPNMPKEYIVKLVMDRRHKSVMVLKHNQVYGGITYRPFFSQKFGEIAFCAIKSGEQMKGYGSRLMNHLKQHVRDVDGLTQFITYADNNAVKYFAKQGFTKELDMAEDRWKGYIKEYDGGCLMKCNIHPKIPYTDMSTLIRRQRQAIDGRIKELSNCHIVYPGIDFQKKEAGIPKKPISVESIPGLREAGWTCEDWGYSKFRMTASSDYATNRQSSNAFMHTLLKAMHDHADSWPFKEPVDEKEVPDYYVIIKDPMDLRTMAKRLESDQYYITFEMFTADVKKIFTNAKKYNSPETIYYKCAHRLENFFWNKVHAAKLR